MIKTEHRPKDPIIVIDAMDNLHIPITIKPLPALLAPSSHQGISPSLSTSSLQSITSCRLRQPSESIEIMSASEPSPLPQVPSSTAFTYCSVIQKQSKEIQELRQDIIKLNQKYIEQIERIQIAEQARHQVESELEDLSLKLFEQANKMVADEKKARFHAEKKVMQLERELTSVYEELGHERDQLGELRLKFERENNEPAVSIHPLESSPQEQQQQQQQQQTPECARDIVDNCISTSNLLQPNVYLDNGWLILFQEFLAMAPNTPLDLIFKLPFMKQCLELDVEPCLRFGNKKSSQLSMRKVLDAIVHQPCFIEAESKMEKRRSHDDRGTAAKKAPVVRRSSFAFHLTGRFQAAQPCASDKGSQPCYGCGAALEAPMFRFRLREQDLDYYPIDRACRDRLVAACDFFVFIRHVRSGLQSQKTLQSLFRECVWLRLCMFWARSGVHYQHGSLHQSPPTQKHFLLPTP